MLAREADEQAPPVEAGDQHEAQQGKEELNLTAGQVLRGIYESGLRRIRVAPVELVEVFVALAGSVFRSNRSYLIC